MSESPLIDKIVSILEPFMGARMARASLKIYVNEIKIVHGSFDVSHLDRIVERLQPGLQAFVGGEKAIALTRELKNLKKMKGLKA